MNVKFTKTNLDGVFIIESDFFKDERGYFRELFHSNNYKELNVSFVQDNFSHSEKNVLRGLHYQLKNPQGKLVTVLEGEVFDVAVDIRKDSPTFRNWLGVNLSSTNGKQLYVPPGFAHGFCVLSEYADVFYKCTDLYAPRDEYSLLWSDSDIKIKWPISEPKLSKKDAEAPMLEQIPADSLPEYIK